MANGKRGWTSGVNGEAPEDVGRLPESVELEVRRRLRGGEDLEVAVAGDITPEGRFGFVGLAASEERLLLLSGDPEGELQVEEIPLEEVLSIRHKTYVGNGELEVITYERGLRSVRHSRSLDRAFEKASQKLGRLLRQHRLNGRLREEEEQEEDDF